ncbi:MAG TPA: hypothetical protein VM802_22665 [Chitinophaga sp.]|uniref:hypothetical protein n=1 Tax=Chitinophaga sp. TaxID=1869181 RepID=UPI002BF3B1BC|nr:hypothetical protein [Chitinophaga sp.]HVI47692.1 hypothetical protein [Chitinophaga sp.]
MKHLEKVINKKKLLPIIIAASASLPFTACQQKIDTPELSCPELSMTATLQDKTNSLKLVTNTIFSQENDSAVTKYLSLEALSDTMKVIINVIDPGYPYNAKTNDSLRLATYRFSRTANLQGGLVVAGMRNKDGSISYFTTDSSSVTINRVNTVRKTVSGTFTFVADKGAIAGKGTFQNACYVTLQ